MGHNILIAAPLSDGAILTASGEVASMPARNLLRMQPRDAWRALDPAAPSLVLDLGAARTVNLAALLFTNASATATWRIRAAASEAGLTAAPGYDSGMLTIWPAGVPGAGLATYPWVDAIKFLAAAGGPGAQTFRWWRIDIADPANPAGYFDAGRLYLAQGEQPASNLVYGWSVLALDGADQAESAGGQTYVTTRARGGRVLQFELRWATEAEAMGWLMDLDRRRGASRDILVIRDPERPELYPLQAVYGVMTAPRETRNTTHGRYGKAFAVKLLLP